MQDLDRTLDSPIAQPVFQIIIDVFGPSGAKGLIAVILICVWFAGLFSLTSNSRMYYRCAQTNVPCSDGLRQLTHSYAPHS
jgi:hypothetical protein